MQAALKADRLQYTEDAVSYALSHRIRIEILCLLNEAIYTASELATHTPWSLPAISYHLKEMLRSGSIEVARIEKVRNVDQHFYRAVEIPEIDDEEAAALPPEVKQQYAAVILQEVIAECLGALRCQKLNQPLVRMMWSWFNLGEQGRKELADEQLESWRRMVEIAVRDANRRAKSGEEGKSIIAVTLGFERCHAGPSPAPTRHRLCPKNELSDSGNPE